MYKFIIKSLLILSSNCQQICTPNSNLNNYNVDYNNANARYENNTLNLYLTRDIGGSRITIGQPLQYGEINVVMKVSEGNNIVSAFYLKAENGDEIDFEMVRNRTELNKIIQTVFYYRGIPLYEVNAIYYISDIPLSKNYNKYTIVWMPDYYEWKLNDILIRRTTRNDTDTYPDTISSIKITIWEAQPSNWAGPGINWEQEQFILSISSIDINCDLSNIINPISNITENTSILTTTTTSPITKSFNKTTITPYIKVITTDKIINNSTYITLYTNFIFSITVFLYFYFI